MSTNIPKEKWRDYIAAVESVERYRDLSDEEKEMIARRILSKRYLDLRCDWAFKKDDYNILMPVYVICFMDFRLKHDTDQLVYRYMMKERDSGEVYNNLLTICLCELPRLKAKKIDGMNDIESWFYILENIHNFAGDPGEFGEAVYPGYGTGSDRSASGHEQT